MHLTVPRVLLTVVILALVLATARPARSEPWPTKPVLSLATAREILQAAQAHARENQWNVCIAIVDDGGHLICFERMDGTQTGSVLVSQEKARTACAFKRPTRIFEEGVAGGRNALLALPGATPLEGGLPLLVDGIVVGAIGVSGVTAQQDGQIAQAGVDALQQLLTAANAPSSR